MEEGRIKRFLAQRRGSVILSLQATHRLSHDREVQANGSQPHNPIRIITSSQWGIVTIQPSKGS